MKLVLDRKYFSMGTNGVLMLDSMALCHTIELPWKENHSQVSCIPEGEYEVAKRFSEKFKWHLQLLNVPKRDLILIHPANNALMELKGCLAPVTIITGPGTGLRSRVVFNKLITLVYPVLDKNETVLLTIKNFNYEQT